MRLLGASPSETIMVGDSPNDLIAAKKANIDSVLYFPFKHEVFYDIDDLIALSPTFIVHNWAELCPTIF